MGYDKSPLIKQAEDNYLPRHTSMTAESEILDRKEEPCEKCGQPFGIGDWPFCPHGRSRLMTIGDSIPGGLEIRNSLCNLDGTPRVYYSHSEIRREAEKRGFTNVVTHLGEPGSDKSRHTVRHI